MLAIDAVVTHVKVITQISNLNILKGPGTDQPIEGKAAHGEVITLVNKSNDMWWLVRTKNGEEAIVMHNIWKLKLKNANRFLMFLKPRDLFKIK